MMTTMPSTCGGLTVTEHQTVQDVLHRYLLPPDCYHAFMKAHLRISVKDFLKTHRRYMAC
jgi:hypothetical protein